MNEVYGYCFFIFFKEVFKLVNNNNFKFYKDKSSEIFF